MNGIPLLDSIPVNWFILGTSVLAGVILFLILTQIPDDDEETKEEINQNPPNPTEKSESVNEVVRKKGSKVAKKERKKRK